jgi:hypothetical protein
MSNVSALTNLRALLSYLGDGASEIVEGLARALPDHLKASDALTLYAAAAVHTIVALDASTGAYPLALIAKSNGTACVVKLYAADDATVGTTDAILSVAVSGTSGELSCALLLGAGPYRLGATDGSGIGIAAPSTDVGTGAVANDPNVWVLYADA